MRNFAAKTQAPRKGTPAKSIPTRAHHWQRRGVNSILRLQRTIGNKAVQRMLQTNPEELQIGLASTASPLFGYNFSRIPIHPSAAAIQTKLAINKPGDIYEQEADELAEQVMRASGDQSPTLARNQTQARPLQASPAPGVRDGTEGVGAVSPEISERTVATKGGGSRLDGRTRSFMESRFGADFGRVKIHTESVIQRQPQPPPPPQPQTQTPQSPAPVANLGEVNEQIKIIGEIDIPYDIWRTNFGKGSRPDKNILVDRKIVAAKKLGDLRDQRAIITLVAVLNDNVYGVARLDPTSKAQILAEATEALGKIGGQDAVAQLTKMLDSAELPKRKMAAKAFRHLRGRAAGLELVLRLSGEPDLDVKADIAFALGEIGPNLAAGPLANLMAGELIKVLGGIKTTSQNWLLGNTIKSLGKFKDKRATKPLLDILMDRRDNEAILNLGIDALGMIGDPDAADFLDTWLRLSPSSSIRTSAADALGAIGAKAGGKIALGKLRKRLDSNLEKDPRVVQAIKKALKVP
jgi:HEAT repeats/Domain of unknown function (DUF4157)/PBS lyase HEAT-like repeat